MNPFIPHKRKRPSKSEIEEKQSRLNSFESSFFYKKPPENINPQMAQKLREIAEKYLHEVESEMKEMPELTKQLSEDILSETKLKICRVRHIGELFSQVNVTLSPLTIESMKASGEHRFAMNDASFVDD